MDRRRVHPAVSADLLQGEEGGRRRGAGAAPARLYAGFTAVSVVVRYKSGAIWERVGTEHWIHLTPVSLGVVYALLFLFPLLAVPQFFARPAILSATSVFRDT